MTSPMPAVQSSLWHKHVHNFDIDKYLNRFVPRPRFYVLPRPISHFFGYRPPNCKPRPPPAQPVVWLSACLGGFIGIAIISAVYHALPVLGGQQAPLIIASFGAAAILEYNTIESPLSQPRNLIFGHLLSALIGVAITKGFEQLPEHRFDELRWLAGSISVGVASMAMSITKTVHPPAGATALLASTSVEITVLGWWLLPLVLLASCLMSASALLINNLTRRWPLYWWTAADLSRTNEIKHAADVEQQLSERASSIASGSTKHSQQQPQHTKHVDESDTESGFDRTLEHHERLGHDMSQSQIVITPETVVLPDWMELDGWETDVLEVIKQKLHRSRADTSLG